MRLSYSDKQALLGLGMILLAVLIALYLGVWVCFVGGIAQFVGALQGSEVHPLAAGIGVLRFMCSGVVGWGSFAALVIPGIAILKSA